MRYGMSYLRSQIDGEKVLDLGEFQLFQIRSVQPVACTILEEGGKKKCAKTFRLLKMPWLPIDGPVTAS